MLINVVFWICFGCMFMMMFFGFGCVVIIFWILGVSVILLNGRVSLIVVSLVGKKFMVGELIKFVINRLVGCL